MGPKTILAECRAWLECLLSFDIWLNQKIPFQTKNSEKDRTLAKKKSVRWGGVGGGWTAGSVAQ